MNTAPTLSLFSVVLININIMFGTGIFINTLILINLTGPLGGLSYACIALLITPLVLCFSALVKKYPEGGMYSYATHAFGTTVGCISTLTYFFAKLASAALLLQVATQCIATLLHNLPSMLYGKLGIILLCTLINTRVFSTGRFLMYFFLACKMIPILTLIGCCITQWHTTNVNYTLANVYGLINSLPLVLYAFTGFEACCSVSNFLAHPAKDAPKALIISFCSVVGLTIIYQTIVSLQLVDQLSISSVTITTFFPTLFAALSINDVILSPILYSIVACGCLGGVYAILLSNYWNLYRLAQQQLLAHHKVLSRLNNYAIPQNCVILQGVICMLYVLFLQENSTLLQHLSVTGCIISFSISALALIRVGDRSERITAIVGLSTCAILFLLILKKFFS